MAKVHVVLSAIAALNGFAAVIKDLSFDNSEKVTINELNNEIKYTEESHNNWLRISDNWHINKMNFKKNDLGMAEVLLKIKTLDMAKIIGINYKYSLVRMSFSCEDKNYKVNEVRNVINKGNGLVSKYDTIYDTNNPKSKEWGKVEENGKSLHKSLVYVCTEM